MKKLFLFISFFCCTVFAQNKSIFWEAKKDSTNIYILGSNHLYPIDSVLHKEDINKIISKSDVFFVELNPKSEIVDSIFNSRKKTNSKKELGNSYNIYKSLYPDTKYLDKLTSKEIWFKLYRKKIELSCKYNGNKKMEDYFFEIAKDNNKKIIEFEDSKEQLIQIDKALKYNDSQMWKFNIKLLNEIYKNKLDDGCIDKVKIIKNRYEFNFDKIISEDSKQTWDDRNIKWLEKLENEISNNHYKNIFIMVGIGHLDYSNGLVMLLKKNGFNINPIIL